MKPTGDRPAIPGSAEIADPSDGAAPAWQLSLRGLRAFIAVEETGSIVGAAARLETSASGISQHVTLLEAAVGARLFDRRARPITLTPAGRALSRHARRILAVISEAETDLAALDLRSLPELNLAIIDDLDTTLTPALVSALQEQYPRSFVNAFSGRSDQVVARFEQRTADIAVTARLPEDTGGLQVLPLLREPFVLAVARAALRPDEALRDALRRLPFVRYADSIPLGLKVSLMLRRARIEPAGRVAFETTRSVIAMVAQSGGWTVTTPLNLLDAEPQLDCLQIAPLPFAGEARLVHLLSREGELGGLPYSLARACRMIVRARIAPRFDALAPEMAGAIEAIGGEDEVV